ncbi:uncharacterized protein LOC117209360 [Bombus bifarius]|uniref:Uncharacterized protein LOC117209360 n=1 Tax=Bombus bifarius TaxID=103933 RepID=A0A6P8MBV5_9HYME|nr:uncharacterized protein LOC117209360 [Bombus bifarius]
MKTFPGEIAKNKRKNDRNRFQDDMYTVFSPGGKDCMGVKRGSQIVAVFDTVGNGAVFDEDGATRLSYNQIGGIWRDNPTGVPLTWKWDIREKKSITKVVYLVGVDFSISYIYAISLKVIDYGNVLKTMYNTVYKRFHALVNF